MKSSPSTSSNCGSLIMVALAAFLVLEITSTFAAAYPASYSGYYSPVGLEEQNPSYVNLQQAIARLRQAFIDNNELENKNNIDQAITDLLEVSRDAFDIWFQHYQERLKLMLIENISEGEKMHSGTKSSKRSGMDFGYGRGYSGKMAIKHLMGLAAAVNGPQAPGPVLKHRNADEA